MSEKSSLGDKFRRVIYQSNIVKQVYTLYFLPWMTFTSSYPIGSNIFDSEWDLLLVLDACRVDALREVAPEYPWLSTVDAKTSVGSTSKEWIANTFTIDYREEINRTAYVTANGWSQSVLVDSPDFLEYAFTKDTWIQSHKELLNRFVERDLVTTDEFSVFEPVVHLADQNSYRTPNAPQVTDRAIRVGREIDPERMIVHYLQPHAPYIGRVMDDNELLDRDERPYQALRNGADKEDVWNSYLDNIRHVLDSIEVLRENINADKVVITADHGELFGEWGVYNHIGGILHPSLKRVPWAQTTASDSKERVPTRDKTKDAADTTEEDFKQRLKDLGYL